MAFLSSLSPSPGQGWEWEGQASAVFPPEITFLLLRDIWTRWVFMPWKYQCISTVLTPKFGLFCDLEQNYVCFISFQSKGHVGHFLLSFSLWNMWFFQTFQSTNLRKADFILTFIEKFYSWVLIPFKKLKIIFTIAILQKKRWRHGMSNCLVQDFGIADWLSITWIQKCIWLLCPGRWPWCHAPSPQSKCDWCWNRCDSEGAVSLDEKEWWNRGWFCVRSRNWDVL